MCIVDEITFTSCAHATHFLLFPCASGFSVFNKHCNVNSHIIRFHLDSATSDDTRTQVHCTECYSSTLKMIREDYAKRYLDLEKEARFLGWGKDDIRGSLMEMQVEMNEVVQEWKVSCGQETDVEEMKLDAFAESIRFRFGPTPVQDRLAYEGEKPYFFNAGDVDNARKYSMSKAKSRALSRSRARKTAKNSSAVRIQRLVATF